VDGDKDRHDETVIFRNFAKAPEKSKSVVEAGNLAYMGRKHIFLLGKSEENRPLEFLAVDGRQHYNGCSRNKMRRHKID